jgi:hypothetical protein
MDRAIPKDWEHGIEAQGVMEPWADGSDMLFSCQLLSTGTDAVGNAST